MATGKQELGEFGENIVAKKCSCPSCKRGKTLVKLPPNFKCADLICNFCGYLAQVKTVTTTKIDRIPSNVMGASWGPQRERMESGIYFPLYLVLATAGRKTYSIFYLSADLQPPELFKPRLPLSGKAKRAGWTSFRYDLKAVEGRLVRLA